MGSDLYIVIGVQHPHTDGVDPKHWRPLWEGPSTFLARGIVVDAFADGSRSETAGHLTHDAWEKMAEHPECPWRLDEPYWVRLIEGREFTAIIHEKRWQKLQDGDFYDTECGPELRAFAVFVECLIAEGLNVRVWCWHSQ